MRVFLRYLLAEPRNSLLILSLHPLNLFLADLLAAALAVLHESLEFDLQETHFGPELVLFLLDFMCEALVDGHLDLVVASEEADVGAGLF